MGQQQSAFLDDDAPTDTLTSRSLKAVADYILCGQARRIVCMTGAGISTRAGIPDFRTPGTGLYANLKALNLPRGEDVFDLEFFEENPQPFYILAKDLYPGKYFPTVSHVFISLLAKKHLLHQLFTQNIDTLERRAGIPPHLIVEAHGSFADQHCIKCREAFPEDKFREYIERQEVVHCIKEDCDGLVKPDIVFFGEPLPPLFYNRINKADEADLVLVLGTSLSVQPFASLPDQARERTPRVLFNMDRVGSFGCRPDDVLELGDCDTGVRKLAEALGWRDELEFEWRKLVGDDEADKQTNGRGERLTNLEEKVHQLAENIERAMHIGDAEDTNDGDSSVGGPEEGGGEYKVVGGDEPKRGDEHEVVSGDQRGRGGRDHGNFRGGVAPIPTEERPGHSGSQESPGGGDPNVPNEERPNHGASQDQMEGGHIPGVEHPDARSSHDQLEGRDHRDLGGGDHGGEGASIPAENRRGHDTSQDGQGGDHGYLGGGVVGGVPDKTSTPLLPLGSGLLPGKVAGEAVAGNSEVVGG